MKISLKKLESYSGLALGTFLLAGGVTVTAVSTDTTTSIPVYSIAKGTDHYLTTDINRVNQLLKQGYNSKTVISYQPVTGGTTIHSWYSTQQGHYLTTDDSATNQARLTALGYVEMDGSTGLLSASSTDGNAMPAMSGPMLKAAIIIMLMAIIRSHLQFMATVKLLGMAIMSQQ